MKVFVLGHRGMLGHVVARYLREQGIHVLSSNHRYAGLPGDKLISTVCDSDAQWVVNAIGKVDPKSTSPSEMLQINAQLPIHLASFLRSDQRLIHASSDGVFSGKAGNYPSTSDRDAQDCYGLSKILAEIIAKENKTFVIRTSIIGPPRVGCGGLIDWFLSQKDMVKGFEDHFWNGITTLEWAKIAQEIITGRLIPPSPLFHATCKEPLSKYELLKRIAEAWNHRITVVPTASGAPVNRSLLPDVRRSPIDRQLLELRNWCGKHCDLSEDI